MRRFNCVDCSVGEFGSPAEYLFLEIKIYVDEITDYIIDF